jgi:hypothetical protein
MFRRILRKKYRRAVGTHYGPTRIRQAEFSLCHGRDGRAGTTILQLVSASDDRTKALPSDYGPAGLLEQGQRRRIRRSRRTVLRDYGPEEAASSRRRAVGTTGPFQGPRADREQRTPPSIPPGPQYLPRNYGPGRIRRMAMLECTTASGRHDHATFRERANESVRCSGFGPKLLHADQPRGLGPGSQMTFN